MDNKTNEILQKLSSQKLQLSSFRELKEKNIKLEKAGTKLDNAWRNLSDYFTRAEKPYRDMMSAYDEAFGFLNNAELVYKSFAKGAEELGVEPKSVKEYRDMKNIIDEVKKMESIVDDLDRNYKNIQP